jgi:hypothetical protein
MEDSRVATNPNDTRDDDRSGERGLDFTRRALLRAGWLAPVVTAVSIPPAFAQSPIPPAHTDHTDHTDLPHTDEAHSDSLHGDHADAPHQDHQDHQDTHADAHGDTHLDVHSDEPGPHADVPHQDANQKRF